MKTITTLIILIGMIFSISGISQTIWNGAPTPFTKADGADWNLQANQDRITSTVWITRANSKGLFNIFSENSHDKAVSPVDTEWAFGTTADIASLTFQAWRDAVNEDPQSSVNQDMVVHLITDDIYIDIKMLSWSSGGSGGQGGFSYTRSTDQTIGIDDLNKKQLAVYPNPATDYLTIKDISAQGEAEIFNIAGKRIQELNVSAGNTIDISSLQSGMYFLFIPDHGFTKFIKE